MLRYHNRMYRIVLALCLVPAFAQQQKEPPKEPSKETPKPAELTPASGGMPAPTATVPTPAPETRPAAGRPADTHRRPPPARPRRPNDLVDPF